jgi:hypothetical protein
VVGGTEEDAKRLQNNGSIVYADADALASNFELFADALQRMDFAEQSPDGIMQIGLEEHVMTKSELLVQF